ncbi:hypothetical protein BKP56_07595 [Marinilactibacillus sp. 15R]|uniref:DUF3006 domain-containing protein n=1 Tax=Marinilactibacillus piezotolerans TaxID=258723 RepID=A0A1I3ZLC0_9LACT|nr:MULTISPECIES: DUF3006 family protein [Marinilactibacillus]API89124.1 hypothetical protein BKP56_07595 [Marinilactibacillus sp. 15R]SFK44740.1 Protein of unknown function [Marinilactibacillus piezotolerans]
MKVVFESLENNLAKLVPDSKSDEIIVRKEMLPKGCKIGDVLEIEQSDKDAEVSVKILRSETKKRFQANKEKRQRLLKRKH